MEKNFERIQSEFRCWHINSRLSQNPKWPRLLNCNYASVNEKRKLQVANFQKKGTFMGSVIHVKLWKPLKPQRSAHLSCGIELELAHIFPAEKLIHFFQVVGAMEQMLGISSRMKICLAVRLFQQGNSSIKFFWRCSSPSVEPCLQIKLYGKRDIGQCSIYSFLQICRMPKDLYSIVAPVRQLSPYSDIPSKAFL